MSKNPSSRSVSQPDVSSEGFFARHRPADGASRWVLQLALDRSSLREVAELTRPFLLRPELYEPIAPEWLHMTLMVLGSTRRVTETQVQALCDQLAGALARLQAPSLELRDPWNWSGSICLAVSPEPWLRDLHARLCAETAGLHDTDTILGDPFVPHVTLAYPRVPPGQGALGQKSLPAWHRLLPPPIAIDLVEQWPSPPEYHWRTLRQLALSSPLGAASKI